MGLTTLLHGIAPWLTERPHEVAPFLVLLFPLAGFVVLALFGEGLKKEGRSAAAGYIASAMALLSFAAAAVSAWGLTLLAPQVPAAVAHGRAGPPLVFAQPNLASGLAQGLAWIDVGNLRIPFSLLLDPLSALMILTVTGVGSVIHVYSIGYMAHDEERERYFSYLNLFLFFMLLLVLGGSLPLLFVGWEGVGLCSYLLIGFWFKKKSAAAAGLKAFVVNRVGDAGLILGMVLAFHAFGTLDLADLVEAVSSKPPEGLGELGVLTVLALLLFVGATGKSAQVPLHVWLPDAMEGPTPVSALIHAATMVTAGVYMVARLGPLYARSETALAVVAGVGLLTAVMAATVALVQTDIKRVLAYSTVSQLGYMFLAAGVGAFGVAVFHLFTHAFFKALLFLGAGSVIHALSGEQDMRRMGGLWRKVPWTYGTFLVGTLAIAGIPPLSGFVSKDAILAAAWQGGHRVLFALGLLTAALTAFYMGRLFFLTFHGAWRGEAAPEAPGHGPAGSGHGPGAVHESPWSMLLPLVLLAVGSAVAGLVAVPQRVGPVFRGVGMAPHHSAWLPLVATATAVLGLAAAWSLYLLHPDLPGRLRSRFLAAWRVLDARYGFDLAYGWLTRRAVIGGSEALLWRRVDASLIDGAVDGTGAAVAAAAERTRSAQTGLVRAYALLVLGGAVVLLACLLWK